MRWARTDDRTVYVIVGPSGGRPDVEPVPPPPSEPPGVVQLIGDAIFYRHRVRTAMLGAIGRWLAHWVIFRGGWTVYVDAPDSDPVKIRCANRLAAQERAEQLVEEISANGYDSPSGLTSTSMGGMRGGWATATCCHPQEP
jgi:hypothetical protein